MSVPEPPFDKPPFFVVGAPRSGTTYLRELLNTHRDVFLTNETRVMVFASRAINDLAENKQALLHHKRAFLDVLRDELPRTIVRYYRDLGATGHVRWGDKHPQYADPGLDEPCLDTIDDLFAGSQFVHIVRDPRDVVASITRKGWLGVEGAIDVWKQTVEHTRHFGDKLGPDRYLEIRYDDLVSRGVPTTARILDFLGLELDDTVVEFLERQEKSRTPFSRPTTSEGALGESSWRDHFPEEEARLLEARLGPELRSLGFAAGAPAPQAAHALRVHYLTSPGASDPAHTLIGAGLVERGWHFHRHSEPASVVSSLRELGGPAVVHLDDIDGLYADPDAGVADRRLQDLIQQLDESLAEGAALVLRLRDLAGAGDHPQVEQRALDAICERASALLVPSDSARDAATAVGETPVAVVPAPSYAGVYGDIPLRSRSRSELAIPRDDFVMLMVGDLDRRGGHLDAMRAFAAAGVPDGRLVIVGRPTSDEYLAELEAAADVARGRVRLVALPPQRTAVPLWLGAADALVTASRDDLSPEPVLLGLSYGVPAVVPAVGIFKELVADGVNGVHYAAGDVDGLARALFTAATMTPPEREAVRTGVAAWDASAVAGALEDAYLAAAGIAQPAA